MIKHDRCWDSKEVLRGTKYDFCIMKMNDFPVDLTDTLSKTKALVMNASLQAGAFYEDRGIMGLLSDAQHLACVFVVLADILVRSHRNYIFFHHRIKPFTSKYPKKHL